MNAPKRPISHCKAITDWCRLRGEPIYALARRAGVSFPTLYRILNGSTRQPSIDTLQKLAYAMDHMPLMKLVDSLNQPPE